MKIDRDGACLYELFQDGHNEDGSPNIVRRWYAVVCPWHGKCSDAEAEQIAALLQMAPALEREVDENTGVIAVWRGRTMRAEAERDKLRAAVERIRSEIAWLDGIDPHAIAIADYDGSASIIKACCDAVIAETHNQQPQPEN